MIDLHDYTVCASPPPATLTVDMLAELLREVGRLEARRADPLKAFMRQHGFEPDRGDLMVLPPWLFEQLSPAPFLRCSSLVGGVVLLRQPARLLPWLINEKAPL